MVYNLDSWHARYDVWLLNLRNETRTTVKNFQQHIYIYMVVHNS